MGEKKRGRKKGSKNRLKGLPENYSFWCGILKSDHIKEFIKRGDQRQKQLIKHTLEYMKKEDPETFEYVKGNKILIKQLAEWGYRFN